MEFLRILSSFLLNEYGKDFAPIIKLLEDNSFDLKKTVKNIKPEMLAPLIRAVMSGIKTPASPTVSAGLEPIKNVADEQVVATLNNYFSAN